MFITLHFHCAASKRFFIQENAISQKEIINQTTASITLEDQGILFENSHWVYSIKRDG